MNIASQIQALTFAVVALTAALVGPVIFWGFRTLVDHQQAASLERLLEVEAHRLAAPFTELKHDIAVLEALPVLDGLMARRPDITAALPPARLETLMAQVYTAVARSKPHYSQIRLIGVADDGRELVRVDRTADGIRVASADELQSKGHRPYFTAARATAPGSTYVSRVELNREFGRIEQPERPTLRIARAVRDPAGAVFGVVVINVDFALLIDQVLEDESDGRTWLVANGDGDYLLHPDPSRTFGFDRGTPYRAQDDLPLLAPLFASDDTRSVAFPYDGSRVAWRRLPLPEMAGHDDLYLGVSAVDASGAEADIANRALLGVGVALALALLLGVVSGARLARPLQRMTGVAAAIARAGTHAQLPVDRADETGMLARAFQSMLERLAEKEHRLEQANADLEQFAYVATHDLREPARRAAAIADVLLFDEAERLSDDGRELTERLQAVAENMLERLADFRVLSDIGSGHIVRQTVSLDPLLDRVIAESSAVIGGREVTFARGPLPTVEAYPELLALAWRNLIADAVRRAGRAPITLTFGARPPRGDEISAGPVLTIRVEGFTLAADDIQGIFTRVARLGEGAAGSGLGLSVCRRIAERHSGWIDASPCDGGTEFTLSLGATDEYSNSAG